MTAAGAALLGILGGWFALVVLFLRRGVVHPTRRVILPSILDGTATFVPSITTVVRLAIVPRLSQPKTPAMRPWMWPAIEYLDSLSAYFHAHWMLKPQTRYSRHALGRVDSSTGDAEVFVFI